MALCANESKTGPVKWRLYPLKYCFMPEFAKELAKAEEKVVRFSWGFFLYSSAPPATTIGHRIGYKSRP